MGKVGQWRTDLHAYRATLFSPAFLKRGSISIGRLATSSIFFNFSLLNSFPGLWLVIPNHFWSGAHVITCRISKNQSQSIFSTAMESSASSLSYGFLTLVQGLSSAGFLRRRFERGVWWHIYFSDFWCKNWITIRIVGALQGQLSSDEVAKWLPRQPLISSVAARNRQIDCVCNLHKVIELSAKFGVILMHHHHRRLHEST